MLRFRPPLLRIVYINIKNDLFKHKSTKASSANYEATQEFHRSDDKASSVNLDTGGRSGTIEATQTSKLQARPPLAKNFFVGEADKELLGFPEVIDREEMENLQNEVLPLKNFFAEEVDGHSIDATRTIAPNLLANIQELGLYGINATQKFGGKDWKWSASLIASEPESNCTDIALGLLSHRVVIDVLKEAGTEEQQERFLNKLASGSFVATEAIYEFDIPEDDFFNTTASHNPETKSWIINGEKAFVVTGPLPAGATQLYLVIAETQRLNMTGNSGKANAIFLIDSSLPGVQLGDQHLTIGARGLQMNRVQFNQVSVPESCVIGDPFQSLHVAELILRSSRLRSSIIGLGLAKNILKEVAQYANKTKVCGVALNELEMTKTHLSKMMCSTYAMESMIYLTAGLLDEFHEPDVSLEAAMTKYYTFRELLKISTCAMDIIGPKTLLAGQMTDSAFRNASQLYTQGESIDALKLFIAFTGLNYAGTFMNDRVRMARNPLSHPGHILGHFLQKSTIENPNTKMRLGDNLHPTLAPAAMSIEHSVARLQMCTELMFTRYGNNIIERHNEVHRLTDMSTAIYAMFASAARASRSYCIGLQLADHELLTATAICSQGGDLVKTLSLEISGGEYLNNDRNLQRLSKQVCKSKGSFAEHPLTYNF